METPIPNTTPVEPTEAAPVSSILETPVEQTVHKNASWGAIISIVVILAMIVVGAFYAWGQRVAEEHGLPATSASNTTY